MDPRDWMKPLRWTPLALLLLLLLPSPVDAQEQRFEGEASVVVVELPVQALRDGKPVRGLTADDFELRAGGKKVPIVGFEVIDVAADAAPVGDADATVPTLPTSARRHFLLLFDLSFSDPSSVVRAQRAAVDLVSRGLQPSDMVAVATYAASRGIEVPLGFTSDRNQLAQALTTLGLVQPHGRYPDPLGLVIGELESDFASRRNAGGAFGVTDAPGAPGATPRRGGPVSAQALDVNFNFLVNAKELEHLGEQVIRDQREDRLLSLTSSLSDLARLLRGVAGRVHIVFLSEGFDSSVVLGNEGARIEDQARSAEVGDYAASGEVWRVDSEARFGSSSARSALFEMLGEFKQAGCTIQAVDIGGVRAGADLDPGSQGQNGLFIMANETGGELYRNTNDLSAAMNEMLDRTSVTYLLAFQPRDLAMDGRYHRLDVRLKRSHKGVRLVHRPGFYEPRPFTELSSQERKITAAGLLQGGAEGGPIGLSLLAAPFHYGSERAYVPVFLEVDGAALMAQPAGQQLPLEIYAYAFDREGAIRDYFAQAVVIDLTKSAILLRYKGYKFWGHFDLPPGQYLVRALVRNAYSGATGVRLLPLEVPEPDVKRVSLLPPFFPEPNGEWVLGREQESEPRSTPYPYIVGRQAVLPAVKPVLTSEGEAEVRLLGYNLGAGSVTLESRLTAADGKAVQGTEIALRERGESPIPGLDHLVATFRPGKVRSGDCSLSITLSQPDTGASDTTTIDCRVR